MHKFNKKIITLLALLCTTICSNAFADDSDVTNIPEEQFFEKKEANKRQIELLKQNINIEQLKLELKRLGVINKPAPKLEIPKVTHENTISKAPSILPQVISIQGIHPNLTATLKSEDYVLKVQKGSLLPHGEKVQKISASGVTIVTKNQVKQLSFYNPSGEK